MLLRIVNERCDSTHLCRYSFAIGPICRSFVTAIAFARFILHDELVPAFTVENLMGCEWCQGVLTLRYLKLGAIQQREEESTEKEKAKRGMIWVKLIISGRRDLGRAPTFRRRLSARCDRHGQ